jgi:hypothetical protein
VLPEVLPAVDNYRQATVESTLRTLSFVEYSQGFENLFARQRGNHNPRVGGSSPSSATCARRRIASHTIVQVRNPQWLGRFLLRAVVAFPLAAFRVPFAAPDPRRVCGRLCSSGFGYACASRAQPHYLTPILSLSLVQKLGGSQTSVNPRIISQRVVVRGFTVAAC